MRRLAAIGLMLIGLLGACVTYRSGAVTSTPIAGCETVTAPGPYVLTVDIAKPAGQCLVIDADGVSIDCQGHTINGIVDVYGSQFSITGCDLIGPNSVVQLHNSTGSTVSGNTFAADGTVVGSGQIIDTRGSGNTITNNTLDGAGRYVNSQAVGFDDGIILFDVDHDLVQGNHISTYWDDGIETSDRVVDTTIDGNVITNADKGITGHYWASWQRDVVSNNTITGAHIGFSFDNAYGPPTPDTVIYFTDVQFIGNKMGAWKLPALVASTFYLQVPTGPYYDDVTGQPRTVTPTYLVADVTFTGNDFSQDVDAPGFLFPAVGMIDGGGNLCGVPPSAGEPFPCPNSGTTTTTSTTTTSSTTSTTSTTVPSPPVTTACHGKKRCSNSR